MTIKMPYQLFINGEMVDAESGRTFDTINPTDETVSIVNIILVLESRQNLTIGLIS